MEKKKIRLGELSTSHTVDQELADNPKCKELSVIVNNALAKQCSNKVNKLKKCNSCPIKNPGWPVINTPFDAKLINTAFDGANGKLPSSTTTNIVKDLHWEAGLGDTSGPASVSNWIPAFVYHYSTAWVPSPYANANWISFYQDANHSGDLDFYFRYRFYLNSNINPSDFGLLMDFYADNSVHEIYVNGQKQSTYNPTILPQAPLNQEYIHHGFLSGRQVHIDLNHNWKQCENEIIVHIKSGQPYVGFLAQNAVNNCYAAKFPSITPLINISWGDSACDCMETNDFEIMCITVCNNYSNVIFEHFSIGRIRIVDELGNPVALLPDGTPSIELHPIGPYCFGDIPACTGNGISCVSREFVLYTRGAKAGKYKILLECICFDVCNNYSINDCFEIILCKD